MDAPQNPEEDLNRFFCIQKLEGKAENFMQSVGFTNPWGRAGFIHIDIAPTVPSIPFHSKDLLNFPIKLI
jgi:hypothetical protein